MVDKQLNTPDITHEKGSNVKNTNIREIVKAIIIVIIIAIYFWPTCIVGFSLSVPERNRSSMQFVLELSQFIIAVSSIFLVTSVILILLIIIDTITTIILR